MCVCVCVSADLINSIFISLTPNGWYPFTTSGYFSTLHCCFLLLFFERFFFLSFLLADVIRVFSVVVLGILYIFFIYFFVFSLFGRLICTHTQFCCDISISVKVAHGNRNLLLNVSWVKHWNQEKRRSIYIGAGLRCCQWIQAKTHTFAPFCNSVYDGSVFFFVAVFSAVQWEKIISFLFNFSLGITHTHTAQFVFILIYKPYQERREKIYGIKIRRRRSSSSKKHMKHTAKIKYLCTYPERKCNWRRQPHETNIRKFYDKTYIDTLFGYGQHTALHPLSILNGKLICTGWS